MQTVLHYGIAGRVEIEVANGALLGDFGHPQAPPLVDVEAAVRQALAEPIEFPALARCVTPGDRVVLALDDGLPLCAQIVTAAVASLIEAGIGPDGIAILRTAAEAEAPGGQLDRGWPDLWKERIAVHTHHPDEAGELAYLATTEAGETIFLNRALTDADLVIPIGCFYPPSVSGYFGLHNAVFPAFSNRRTLGRFRSPQALAARGTAKRKWAHEINEIAWLLGLNFTLQVVPGGGDRLLHVLAGRPEAVRTVGRQLYAAAWQCSLAQRASLVVAGIEGGSDQQTWQNLGRALAVASRLVDEGGAIALCCELHDPPGPGVQCLAGTPSQPDALKRIGRDRPADSAAALQLSQALQRAQVYLLSGIDDDLLEQLEIARVDSAAEIARLARRHGSCVVLGNAPYVAVKVNEG